MQYKTTLLRLIEEDEGQTYIFLWTNKVRNWWGGIPFLRLKMRLKLAMLLNPQQKAISAMVMSVSMSIRETCPRRISANVSMKLCPVDFLMKRLNETSDMLTVSATSRKEICRLKLRFM